MHSKYLERNKQAVTEIEKTKRQEGKDRQREERKGKKNFEKEKERVVDQVNRLVTKENERE